MKKGESMGIKLIIIGGGGREKEVEFEISYWHLLYNVIIIIIA